MKPLNNRRSLLTAIFLLFACVAMAWKFPNDVPLGELFFQALGLPVWSGGTSGFYFPGILFLLIYCIGFRLLYVTVLRQRLFLTIVLFIFIPAIAQIAEAGYQAIFAKGIYSLDYDRKSSTCSYSAEQSEVKGSCSFSVRNYGSKAVNFTVSLRDVQPFSDSFDIVPDLIGEQMLTISPHERKTYAVPFQKKLPDGKAITAMGSFNGLKVTIKGENTARNL